MIKKNSPFHPLSEREGAKSIKKIVLSFALMLLTSAVFAQDASQAPVEMASGLYQSGKIYVVVTVLSIIFIGIICYIIMLDRKISRLEKEMEKK
jgi:CcmD family protein